MRIVFMGTPDFAVAALVALKEAGHDIVGVYTRMDTPKNRGMKMLPPPVKVQALEYGIPVYQPKNLRSEEVQQELRDMEPEVIVVAAYGRILPQAVLDIPKYGCLNIHASLLPKYRGASPINACILHGETEAGVTIMQMDAGLDTGDMLLPAATEMLPDESYGSLHDRLAKIGGEAIVKALDLLEKGELKGEPQPETGFTYAPMIQTADCKIDFTKPLEMFDPDATWKRKVFEDYEARELLVPIFYNGHLVYRVPDIETSRAYCQRQVDALWDEVKRFENPHNYYVDLSQKLWDIKQQLLMENHK